MSEKPERPPNDDERDAKIEAADIAISEFWRKQYRGGEWIRLTLIADWVAARDQSGKRIARDEMIIDGPSLAAYSKLSKALAANFFKPIIIVSSEWLLADSLSPWLADGEIPARSIITADQFRDALRSFEADPDHLFIKTYLQNMAVTNRGCSDWLSREGYDLPPWLAVARAVSRAGAKPRWDWLEGKAFALKVFTERGDFSDEQNHAPGWSSQTDLEKMVQLHVTKINARTRAVAEGNEPVESTVRGYVAEWLAEWRGQ